jgi:hypothetical protein
VAARETGGGEGGGEEDGEYAEDWEVEVERQGEWGGGGGGPEIPDGVWVVGMVVEGLVSSLVHGLMFALVIYGP